MSANKAQPAHFRSLAQLAKKSQVANFERVCKVFGINTSVTYCSAGSRGMPFRHSQETLHISKILSQIKDRHV